MRVISGLARGRRLKTLPSLRVRPTGDRVKEAMFSMIGSRMGLAGACVLDLFAGSGALGIEALSRGAGRCVFVEHDRKARSVLSDNLRQCGFIEGAEIVGRAARGAVEDLRRREQFFDLVLMDPPYADERAPELVAALADGDLINPGGAVVIEHPAERTFSDVGTLRLTRTRHYGKTGVTLLTRAGSKASSGDD